MRGGVLWGQSLSCEKNMTNDSSQRRQGRGSTPRSISRKRAGGWGQGDCKNLAGCGDEMGVRETPEMSPGLSAAAHAQTGGSGARRAGSRTTPPLGPLV